MVVGKIHRVGGRVNVSAEGLHVLASECGDAESALSEAAMGSKLGPAGQSTAAAVARGYDSLAGASAVLAQRMSFTGAKLRDAARAYLAEDESSGQRIRAIGGSIEA